MTGENLVKKVLDKIKSGGIKPKPKWQFLLKDWLIWLFFVLTIVFGGLAFSATIFLVRINDWDLYGRLPIPFFLKTLPFFWIIIVLIFIGLAYYNFKHTQSGYRYRFWVIVSAAVFLSFFAGTIFHFLRLGELVEYRFQRAMPFYHNIIMRPSFEHQMDAWSNPERGFLAGQVVSVYAPDNFELEDFGGQVWTVFNREGIKRRFEFELSQGVWLKALGEEIDESNFQAVEIRPWLGPMEFNMPVMKEMTPPLRMYR